MSELLVIVELQQKTQGVPVSGLFTAEGQLLLGHEQLLPYISGSGIAEFVQSQEKRAQFQAEGGETLTVCKISAADALSEIVAKGQRQLRAQRLETLGLLAGGVAHDFNNILAGILGHVTYLKTILPQRGSHLESLHAVEDGAKKAALVTQQILNFSKTEQLEKARTLNLNELVTRSCTLLRGAISSRYSLQCDLPPEPVYTNAIEGETVQLLINLVINARDALGSSGSIRVHLAGGVAQEELGQLRWRGSLASPSYCALTVRDNGCGIPAELEEKIFEPYFSTKQDKGTGLGLSTVLSIIRSSGGALRLNSVVGEGTSITVYLPQDFSTPATVAAPKDLDLGAGPKKSSGTVLVVDDEPTVRSVVVMSLKALGYTVFSEEDPLRALDLYKEKRNEIDLVILDMLMPHLSGDELFYCLQEVNPAVRVVLMSGFSSESSVQKVLDSGGLDFIQKPFTLDELSKTVAKALK